MQVEEAQQLTTKHTTYAGILRLYLLAYNVASLAGWAYVLYRLIDHLSTMSSSFTWASLSPTHQQHRALVARASTSYADFGDVVRWVQTSALLEVVHVALGFVRSGLGTTASQVASRLILVWGILLQFPIVGHGTEHFNTETHCS